MKLRVRIGLNFGWSLAVRLSMALGALITTPFLLGHLGAHDFGLWVTVTSIPALLQCFDLGIPNALVNRCARPLQSGQMSEAAEYVVTAYVAMIAIASALLCGATAIALIPPDSLTLSTALAAAGARPALIMVPTFSALLLVTSLVQRIQYAAMDMRHQSLTQLAQLTGTFSLALSAEWLDLNLLQLLSAHFGICLLVQTTNTIMYLPRLRTTPVPRPSLAALRGLWAHARYFAIFQAVFAVTTQSDALIVQNFLTTSEVSEFYAATRILAIPGLIITILNGAVWPVYAATHETGNAGTLRTWLHRFMAGSLILHIATLGLAVAIHESIERHFLAGAVKLSLPTLLACFAWVTVESLSSIQSTFINTTDEIHRQAVLSTGFILCLPLKILLLKPLGMVGIFVAPTIYYVVFVIPRQHHILHHYWINHERGRKNPA